MMRVNVRLPVSGVSRACQAAGIPLLGPVHDFQVFEAGKVFRIRRHEDKAVGVGDCCDLSIDKGGRSAQSFKARPLMAVSCGRHFIVGQDRE